LESNHIPLPPIEYRRLVGPTDPQFFEHAGPTLVFPDVGDAAYTTVFDFGCGCGRLARQLIQQRCRPARYVGVDRHKGMVRWCQENLAPHASGFQFHHHDVLHPQLNPAGIPGHLPLPAEDSDVTLFIAWSVFTHLLEPDAEFYIQEMSRVLGPTGIAVTTWFLFDKLDFPMMQEFQNALLINATDPTNAVIFDRTWLNAQADRAGLVATRITPPAIRGFQWTIHFERQAPGRVPAAFPEDLAPRGLARPPVS
jgi:SAM-dependent methyltransferase